MLKTCSKCGESKQIDMFSPAKQCRDGRRPECKACHNAIEKARDKRHRSSITPEYKRAERFARLYGITLAEYSERLLKQAGKCAICEQPQAWNRREGDVLVVDHDHASGSVRGLLCHACNQSLGLMRDNASLLRTAADYLGSFSA